MLTLRSYTLTPIARRVVLLALSVVLLAACSGGMRSKANVLENTLSNYQGAVRWGGTRDMMAFFDPESEASKNVKAIELERWAQYDVKGYREITPAVVDDEGIARQTVEIELVNKHSATPRMAVDSQVWRFDTDAKRWLLTSGLPIIQKE
jgi:hypothetical protein